MIAVGATTITGCQADYSNAGDDLDVIAPGGGADAPQLRQRLGRRALQPGLARAADRAADVHARRPAASASRAIYEGTSMAAPHVSAIAALLIATKRLGANPSPRDVEAHIEATARPTDRPDRYGAGPGRGRGSALRPRPRSSG